MKPEANKTLVFRLKTFAQGRTVGKYARKIRQAQMKERFEMKEHWQVIRIPKCDPLSDVLF